jgi:arylsulfatase A-like enzyme
MHPRAAGHRPILVALTFWVLSLSSCGPPAATGSTTPAYDAEGRPQQPIPARGQRPNVILIVIDTLRADALRPRAPQDADMPFLSRHAAGGVWCSQASASSSWTLPSIATLFTGVLPRRHGITAADIAAPRLEGLLTWATVMRAALGYSTTALFGGLGEGSLQALRGGFEQIQDAFVLQRTEEQLAGWVATREQGRPFFLVLHTFEAHDPYGAANHPPGGASADASALAALDALGEQPAIEDLVRRTLLDLAQRSVLHTNPRYRARRGDVQRFLWSGLRDTPNPALARELETAYREGLRWVDGLMEETLAYLRRAGLLDNTLLIVTGDHGESFGEHGMLGHGRQLHDELVRVPLLLHGPPPFDRPTELTASVGLIDLFPTLLAWLGAPAPDGLDGVSFLDLVKGPASSRVVIAEELRTHAQTSGASAAVLGSVRAAAWKYVGTHDLMEGTLREELFDLRVDPGEQHARSGTDGLLHELPESPEFRRAVERVRDLLWAQSTKLDWRLARSRTQPLRAAQVPRPPADAAPAR